ncbi:uncharacterized protein LOC143303385 [Bombus vancouverensis nearcticus]|uniref:uncharacterized protein LOC143303385 n=1 Tax=Bombus vancouverensis nearcticus TaxID=2705178 RepID=UPI00402B7F69
MAARNTLEGATGVRRTRAGHILIEFDRTVSVHEAAMRLRAALSDSTEVAAVVNTATLQIRNVDPLTSKEEQVEEMRAQWGIKDSVSVEVKSLKMAPWGTQVAVVVLPANGVPSEDRDRRLRTGLTIASVRLLTGAQRCYKCHMLGHVAAKCTMVCPGRELCRRCGSTECTMKDCDREPRCAMCSGQGGISAKHITGSLAQDLMMQYACESRVGIVVISEPYRQLPYWFNDEFTTCLTVRFDAFWGELDGVLKEGRRSASALMVAGDFNANSSVWGGIRTERRGTCLLNVITKRGLVPIRTTGSYSFLRNGRTSFPDVLCIDRRMRLSWRRSAVLDWYSDSNHFYILHVFTSSVKRAAGGAFVYSMKQIDADSFLSKFDAVYAGHVLKIDESTCGERPQNSLERTCAETLRKTLPSRARRQANYWWNSELATLRSAMCRSRRRAQLAVAARKEDAEFLVAEFKAARRSLKRAIERSKEECGKGFRATLDQDP